MVAGTCNRLLHKKKHEKVEEENNQEWGKKLEGKSVENSHTSSLVKDACMAKEQKSHVSLWTISVILRKVS